MSAPVCRRVTIRGRVQGVYYRGWTEAEATERGLAGWVQNMPDGTVLAQFLGPEDAVSAMVAACWEGPRDARVEAVEVEPIEPVPPIAGFRIHR